MEVVQHCGGCSVHRGDNISTVGDSFSTVEVVQYSGGITVHAGDNISTVEGIQYCGEIPSALWGIPSVLWGDSYSTVEG